MTYAVPVVVGVCLGVALVLDPFLTYGWAARLGSLGRLGAVPYLSSLAMAITLSLACSLPWAWYKNGADRLVLFMLILSVFLTGVPAFLAILSLVAAYLLIFARAAMGERCEVVWSPVYPFILAFTAAVILSLIPLGDLLRWLLQNIRIFVNLGLFLLFINTIRSTPQLERCLNIIFAIGVLWALIGIAQPLLFRFAGLVLIPQRVIFWNTPWWGPVPRAVGLFDHPNALGAALAWVGILMTYLAACGAGYYKRRERAVMLWGSFLVFLALIFSGSRGSWLGAAVALAFIPVIRKPSWILQYVLGMSAAAAAAYVTGLASLVWEQVVRLNPASVDFRAYIADVAWEAMRDHPLLGVGMSNLDTYNNPFRLPAHNLFLQVGSELGAPMGLAFLLLLMAMLVRGIRAAQAALGSKEGLLLQGLLLSFGGVLIHSQTDLFVYSKFFWLQLALLECAILICSRKGLVETVRPIFGR